MTPTCIKITNEIVENEAKSTEIEFQLEDLIDHLPPARNKTEEQYRSLINELAETYQQLHFSYRRMVLQ